MIEKEKPHNPFSASNNISNVEKSIDKKNESYEDEKKPTHSI